MASPVILVFLFTTLCVGFVCSDYFNIFNPDKEPTPLSDSVSRYCESWRINVELNNIRDFTVVPQECIGHIKHYMTSSQYKVDSQTAIEEIKLYVSSCCSLDSDGKDGWIFDIDDTLLSTIPFYKKHQFGGEAVNRSSIEEWMKASKAPAIDHSLNLFNELRNSGFKIFLVSSRPESLRSATVGNLIDAGYHGWSSLNLRGFEDVGSVQEYKTKARKRLMEEQGYRIWGIVGDQWSSFVGLPAAKRTFKLPNSMYYVS